MIRRYHVLAFMLLILGATLHTLITQPSWHNGFVFMLALNACYSQFLYITK